MHLCIAKADGSYVHDTVQPTLKTKDKFPIMENSWCFVQLSCALVRCIISVNNNVQEGEQG